MTSRTAPIESHAVHSDRLIADAEEELAKGDRLQASEKAWGAVAHRLKVIAAQRGWEYTTHRQVYGIVNRLTDELGDEELQHLFAFATGLHQNYYIDAVPLDRLEYEIGRVKDLLEMLKYAEQRT